MPPASSREVGAHDALFKHVFSVPEHAAAELAHVLAPELSSRIEWSSLRLEPGSFVDPELASSHTDLLFSAALGDDSRPAYLYLLFEHQSSPHPLMPLRMVEYVARILRAACERTERTRLPVVVPVVLQHASDPWRDARSMRDLYDADDALLATVGERTLHLAIVVDDLRAEPWRAIAARPMPAMVRVVLGVLRDAREHELGELLTRWGALMVEAARAAGREALAAVIHYLLRVRRIEDARVLLDAVHTHGELELEGIAMDAVEKLKAEGRAEGKAEGRAEGKAEGRAEGKAEGRAEGKAELVLRMLQLRFGALSPLLLDRVRGASADELDRMAERILTAPSAADVVG